MMGGSGGRAVNVKREVLLGHLKENLDKHTRDVAEAKENFKKAGVVLLKKALKDFTSEKTGGKEIRVALAAPSDYSDQYRRVIRMLELSTDDVIQISESDFQKFVLDEWEWQSSFNVTKAFYATASGAK